MPYIPAEDRTMVRTHRCPITPGELNYLITNTIIGYLDTLNRHSYAGYNEVVGVLECVKLEMYRRMVAPYEDKKCVVNGDVYDVQG